MSLRTLCFAVLPLLAACASNAPVREAQIGLPAGFTAPPTDAQVIALDRWWLAFNDAQLTALVEEGLRSAPDARTVAARIGEARATRSANRFSAWPQGALVGRASTTQNEQTAGPPPPFGSQDGRTDTYAADFDVSWELDLFGRTRTANRAVEANHAATLFNIEASRASLAASIADALFSARGLAQQLEDARAANRIATGLRDVTRIRAEHGIAAGADTQRLDADVAQTQAGVLALEADLTAARRSLLVLLGRGAEPVDTLPIEPALSAPPPIPAAVPGELLRRRPDVREAEQRLLLAVDILKVDRLALWPKLTLTPGAGIQRTDSTSAFSFNTGTFATWTLGANLSIPVLDRPKLLATARASGFRAEQAVITYEKAVQTAFGEADSALVQLAADRRRLDLLTAGEAQARASYDSARRRYDLGLDDLTGLLSAEQAWRGARTAQTTARTQAQRRAVQTFKALGGGWQAAPSS